MFDDETWWNASEESPYFPHAAVTYGQEMLVLKFTSEKNLYKSEDEESTQNAFNWLKFILLYPTFWSIFFMYHINGIIFSL